MNEQEHNPQHLEQSRALYHQLSGFAADQRPTALEAAPDWLTGYAKWYSLPIKRVEGLEQPRFSFASPDPEPIIRV
jgi:hypothetical protein